MGYNTHPCPYFNGPLTRYVKLWVAHAPGMPGTFSSATRLHRRPLVCDPDMYHGMCVTHVPWCMPGSLTRGGGENVPGIPGACATSNFTVDVRHGCIITSHTKPLMWLLIGALMWPLLVKGVPAACTTSTIYNAYRHSNRNVTRHF